MSVVDPRERYDDLVVTGGKERLEPEAFEEHANSEAATVGWVVLGYVFDDRDRILLVDEPWADGWTTPGGVPEPGESLADAVVREVREETGVEITPVRPHAVDELTLVDERTGETDGWTAVSFEARADSTAIDDDLGLEGEEIDDADWFERLPEDVFHRELAERVYRRCLGTSR